MLAMGRDVCADAIDASPKLMPQLDRVRHSSQFTRSRVVLAFFVVGDSALLPGRASHVIICAQMPWVHHNGALWPNTHRPLGRLWVLRGSLFPLSAQPPLAAASAGVPLAASRVGLQRILAVPVPRPQWVAPDGVARNALPVHRCRDR